MKWNVTFQVFRKKSDQPGRFDPFELEVDSDEYVLDAIERIWAFHDRSLVYRHACHHSTCGACGMRVNGVEKLTCITPIHEVTHDGGVVRVEPLRNFPVISDLTVDMTEFFQRMEMVHYPAVTSVKKAPKPTIPAENGIRPFDASDDEAETMRLNDCIECGLCISACPVAITSLSYLGPGVLAAAQFQGMKDHQDLTDLVDQADGAWRCHSAFECSAVCPSLVDPAARVMDLRRQVISQRIGHWFKE
jgi:succinate dehydrogenase / fumarate reductase iron-sulfur subunit